MAAFMRAKFQVNKIERFAGYNGEPGQDKITANAVAAKVYPTDGSDEDNTYAKFSPSGELTLTIANPSLVGKIEPGQKFYLDFTPAD